MKPLSRRKALQSTVAVAACSFASSTRTAGGSQQSDEAQQNDEDPVCLTPADDFYTVARGNPKPHTLKGEALVKARMTPESWRLEVVADDELEPPLIKQQAVVEKSKTLKDDTAIDFQQLIELGKTHWVKYIKAMQCLNIPAPLGQGLWKGVPLRDVLGLCGRLNHVRRIYYWGFHNNDPAQIFQSSLTYSQVFETAPGDLPVFLAYELNGKPISPLRGGPVRMIVPWAYGFKSVKWLHKIVLTNDPRANDTYALQNNDPDSPLKTAAYIDRNNKKKFGKDEKVGFHGLVISGLSGLKEVEFLVREKEEGEGFVGSDSILIRHLEWKKAAIQRAPKDWTQVLPADTWSNQLMNFDTKTGQPNRWPLRYGMTGWTVRLDHNLKPGNYELRIRAVDENDFAQPQPRPSQKSGRNEIQIWNFSVG